ncbi:MAG: hypothetical protein LBQ87_01875 [Candidatus Fibromonas sp.]|jgi:hypothetical protein|nr:hypothetical protein [Candidatus Fibromonas sp.]
MSFDSGKNAQAGLRGFIHDSVALSDDDFEKAMRLENNDNNINDIEIMALPLDITTRSEADPFYSKKNQARLRESIAQYKAGKMVVKTMEELKAMENE